MTIKEKPIEFRTFNLRDVPEKEILNGLTMNVWNGSQWVSIPIRIENIILTPTQPTTKISQ